MRAKAVKRKLAAILYADVQGYSRFTGEDEEGSHRMLSATLDHFSELIERREGKILHFAGDAVLAEFQSAVAAVSCAVDFQEQFLNDERLRSSRLPLRIGVNLGEVIVDRGELYGNSVNVAARLETLAEAGGICVSGKVYEEVKNKIDLKFQNLGRVKVKNIEEPVQAYRILLGEAGEVEPYSLFPSTTAISSVRNLSSFVGREAEIDQVGGLLRSHSIVTITGPGGCGKTRLAKQTGISAQTGFSDGVFVIELAAVVNPEQIPQAVATAIGIRERVQQELTTSITEYLGNKSVLMIWDNCEHLLSACSEIVYQLLCTCLGLRVLATSREPLNLPGETIYRLKGLEVPATADGATPSELAECESVSLFVDRVRQRKPGFEIDEASSKVIATICRSLDGIPLAIELAAARVPVLSLSQIAERIEDRFRLLALAGDSRIPHQKTLRATMDWSFEMLDETESRLARCVSVFNEGFFLDAAEAIYSDDEAEKAEVLDLLQHLVEKSIVNVEEHELQARYSMLEIVRQYGVERLAEYGEYEQAEDRHFSFFLDLARRAEPELNGTGGESMQVAWLDVLELEHNNLRSALEGLLARQDAADSLKLAGALWRFWEIRGYQSEGRRFLERALSLQGDSELRDRIKALEGAGRLTWRQGDFAQSKRLFEETLELSRNAADLAGEAGALHGLARAAVNLGDYAAASDLAKQSLELQITCDNRLGMAAVWNTMGEAQRARKDFAEAKRCYREALSRFQQLGDKAACDTVLYNLGITELNLGRIDAAEAMLKEALGDARVIRDQCSIYSCLDGLAGVALAREQYRKAVMFLATAETVGKLGGYVGDLVDQQEVAGFVARARASMDERAYSEAWKLGEQMSVAEAIDHALSGGEN